MIARFATIAIALVLLGASNVSAAQKLSPKPQGAETAFVMGIQKDLTARFPTAADAEKAGYFRYTTEDNTGAISYANLQWQSSDPMHPSQLWYDVNGQLLGADYSVLKSNSPAKPSLWGVNPQRWDDFHAHVHYVVAGDSGDDTYGATSLTKFEAAGGSATDPQAAAVVKMGKAKTAGDVKHVFLFPAVWDLIVWVKPNPAGAFAEKNPNVKPSKTADKDSM